MLIGNACNMAITGAQELIYLKQVEKESFH